MCTVAVSARGQVTRPTTLPNAAPSTAPAATASTRPSDFEVHEWAVFVFDGLADQLNADGVVPSALPAVVPTKRAAGTGTPPPPSAISPVGVIRFVGHVGEPVDVNLSRGGGSFKATWPRAQDRASGELWRSLAVRDGPGGDGPVKVGPGSSFDQLRSTRSAYVVDGKGGCEPFLLYDVQLPFTCPVKVEAAGAAGVRLTNGGSVAVRGLALFRQAGAAWTTATVGELMVTAAATKPASRPSTLPATRATTRAAATRPTTAVATAVATTAVAATRPAPTLLTAAPGAPDALAAGWARRELPGLSDGDRAVVAGLVQRYGFDGGRLTAVYRLDGGDMDRLLPLEVLPQPRRVDRVGIVILRNLDPTAGTDVDDLIAQLGDDSWAKREAATKALTAIGGAAAGRLKDAVAKNGDPEVVWRAERILAAAKTP